jgi:O-antigen/teichoic acid export membrane protein
MRFYFEYKDFKDRNEVISTAMLLIAGIGIIACTLVSFVTDILGSYILDNADLGYFFQIALISMVFQSINGVSYDYLRANQKSLRYILLHFIKLVVGIVLNIYMICFLRLGVVSILLSTLVTSVLIFITLTLPILRTTGVRVSFEKIREMAKFGFPLAISQMGAFVVHLSDRFFIKELWSISDAGLYSLGYRFGTLPGNFASVPFNRTFQPRRLELYNEENSEEIFGRIFTYYLLLLAFCGLCVSVLVRDVLRIMSDAAFWDAYKIVPIIVLGNIIFNMHPHLSMGLLIKKKTKYLAWINGSNGFFVLVLNYFLIKSYGMYGAAYATLIAFIYKISLTYYFSSKVYKIHFEFIRIAKIFVTAIILYVIAKTTLVNSIYLNILKDFGILGFYPVLLFLVKFLSENEKNELQDILKKRFNIRNKRRASALTPD